MTGDFFKNINGLSVEAALAEYLRAGKSVFPVRGRWLGEKQESKHPLVRWKRYQTRLATPDEARQWIKRWPDMGLGFPTGEYNGYNVLDADTDLAETWLAANVPHTVLQSITRKGKHRFFRPGALEIPTLSGIGPVPGIDVRGRGGFVIVAPSVIDDFQYTWATDVAGPAPGAPPVPTLDAMGKAFFTRSRTDPAQVGRKRAHGAENAGNGAFFQERRYNADGLVAIGCRDDYMRDLVLGIIASEKQETGKLPSARYVAETAWRRFEQHADISDDIPKYEHILEKAVYTLGRVADGTIVIRDDDDFPTLPADLPEVDLGELPVDTRWKIIIRRGYDPGDPDLWASKAACTFAVACVLVRAKAKNDLIASVLLDPDLKISDHVLAQPNPRRYAARQIQRAKEICNG